MAMPERGMNCAWLNAAAAPLRAAMSERFDCESMVIAMLKSRAVVMPQICYSTPWRREKVQKRFEAKPTRTCVSTSAGRVGGKFGRGPFPFALLVPYCPQLSLPYDGSLHAPGDWWGWGGA